ncbi:MAG TPA: ABC transporter permease [Pseudonocardia sp.]|nr:ABC transporter permease [Pseudonocardia sp.]
MSSRFVWRRVAWAVVQLFTLAAVVFLGTAALSGDAAVALLGPDYDPVKAARLRSQLHLDEPLGDRFWHWLSGLCRGDLGRSLVSGEPVSHVIESGVASTVILTLATIVVAVPLALSVGLAAGVRADGILDRTLTTVSVGLYAIPDFVLALLLVAVVSLKLHLLPPTALGSDAGTLLRTPALLVLPVVVLSCQCVTSVSRQVRAGVIDTLEHPYVLHAARSGLPRWRVLLCHVAPGALAPAVQNLARVVNSLVGGVLVVETIFAIPGLASALVTAVAARDVPVVQGITVLLGAAALAVNLGSDLLVVRLRPRSALAR